MGVYVNWETARLLTANFGFDPQCPYQDGSECATLRAMKTCYKCKRELTLDQFYKNASKPDGLTAGIQRFPLPGHEGEVESAASSDQGCTHRAGSGSTVASPA
jgi:hypothetical protein